MKNLFSNVEEYRVFATFNHKEWIIYFLICKVTIIFP